MVPDPPSRLQSSRKAEIEDWPYLDEGTLLKTRSRKVCKTCHWFQHHVGEILMIYADLPDALGAEIPRRAPHQQLPGLDRPLGAPEGLGAGGGLSMSKKSEGVMNSVSFARVEGPTGFKALHLYTIGHSNQKMSQLIDLLHQHRINAVADVRSIPFSRRLPQFNKPELETQLPRHDIIYVFLGKELGARREEDSAYDGLQASYERIAELPAFQSGIQRVIKGINKGLTMALLCAERDPITCHRAILVSRHLQSKGIHVDHIHGNGTIENHKSLEQRMFKVLRKLGVLEPSGYALQLDLLGREVACDNARQPNLEIEEAYRQQGKRIAYSKDFAAA